MVRQLPLFPSMPRSPEDINKTTRFKDTFNLFTEHLVKQGKSPHTITAFTSDLHLIGEYLGDEIPVGQFNTSDLNRFLHWLENGRDVPCSRKSYARRVTTIKVYFKWLHSLAAIPHDPAKAVLQRSGPAPLSDVLTMKQIRDAIEFSRTMKLRKGKDEQDLRPEMLLRLLLDTGIKKNEAMAIVPANLDRLNPRQPFLRVRFKVRNVFKERNIDLDPEWVKLLDLYLDQYHPKDTIFNCTARNLEYILTDIGNGAGIPFKVSFEVLRWTCALRDFRLGMKEEDIRQKLGLSEISWYETGNKLKQLDERMSGAEK
jgi:site-specific recombinase XerD